MLLEKTLTSELWREYDFDGRIYRIDYPQTLYYRKGGTTHRIVDREGVTHCCPRPGMDGCVLRWKTIDPDRPVTF